jgi:hypothetical protein
MIYLASAYSHADPVVREARYHAACLTLSACGAAIKADPII